MNPTQEDIARRLIAAGLIPNDSRAQWVRVHAGVDGWLPNLTDDATGGVLFALFCASVGGDVALLTGHSGKRGRVYRIRFAGRLLDGPHDTLGEAAGLALLAGMS